MAKYSCIAKYDNGDGYTKVPLIPCQSDPTYPFWRTNEEDSTLYYYSSLIDLINYIQYTPLRYLDDYASIIAGNDLIEIYEIYQDDKLMMEITFPY
jgi:hypothetical protein